MEIINKNNIFSESKLHEKCGVVGIWTKSNQASYFARRSLAMLQHRGQESTGISIWRGGNIVQLVGMGLVAQVLTDEALKKLGKNTVAIAHNRYSTTGNSTLENSQPLLLTYKKFQISIAHNGNIPDLTYLKKHVKKQLKQTSDTAMLAQLLLEKRELFTNWEETLLDVLPNIIGAFSLAILTEDGNMFAIRDPWGIRPLCFAKLSDGWIFASETVAIDSIGGHYIRDVKNGEIIKISRDGKLNSYFFGKPKRQSFCIFEHIYFSRPDSFINGVRIRSGREESGIRLGIRMKKKHILPDVVVPIFDSGYPAAKGLAQSLGLPLTEAITTSHFSGRTFIKPGQKNRESAVIYKHIVIPDGVVGKRVVFVDDSAVRLTTSTILTKALRNAGAKEIYAAFASPPIVHHCDLGIDLKTNEELPAAKWANKSIEIIEKNIAKLILADYVIYLPIEELAEALGGEKKDFYYTPFGGPHPILGKQEILPSSTKKIKGKPKLSIFISGNGTNLEEIIKRVESNDINAEITSVISNDKNAFGLIRAKNHNIPTFIVSSKGVRKNKKERQFDKELLKAIKESNPDLIILAGWMHILSPYFLRQMTLLQIPVINEHPSLLAADDGNTVFTSRGLIPAIRGTHVIEKAFSENLQVSGVTIHQVLPGDSVDTGPIILKEEVRREEDDTLDSFEKKIHETEYRALSTAIKRTLHVLKHEIAISKGNFPW